MNRYIEQLLEILCAAQSNRPDPTYLELPEEMEYLRDMIELEKSLEESEQTVENILGVSLVYFPPEERLTDEQVRQLKEAILELWRVFHYEADFRKGEFSERQQYTKLLEKWGEHVPVLRGTNGTWHIEMFDYEEYWDEGEMRYLTEDEFAAKYPSSNDLDSFSDYENDIPY